MMKVRLLLLVYLLLLCPLIGRAQHVSYNFRSVGVTDGLPDNYVKSVFGLPDGRVGVRTTVLLNLYDGKNFASFPFQNQIYPIDYYSFTPVQYVDGEERLWLKERGFLRVFDLKRECFIRADSVIAGWKLANRLTDLFVDNRQAVWAVTEDGKVYSCDEGRREMLPVCDAGDFIRHNGAIRVIEAHGDSCWMVHGNGIARCFDCNRHEFVRQEHLLRHPLSGDSPVMMQVLDNGDFWLMWNEGIGYYTSASNSWIPIKGISKDYCGNMAGFDTDNAGNVWLGTVERGVYKIDRYTLTALNVDDMLAETTGKNSNYVHGIYFDKQNTTLWVGFFNQGLAYHHPSMNNLEVYNCENMPGEWQDENIHALLELDDGSIWLGGQNGVCRYDPKQHRMDVPYRELDHQLVRKIYQDSHNRIWVATYRNGLYCIEQGGIKSYLTADTDSIETSNVRTLLEDATGTLWVSVNGGVGRFNPQDGTISFLFEKFPALKKYRLAHTMALDGENRIMVGADNGLYVYDVQADTVWIPEIENPDGPLLAQGSNKYNCILKDSRNLIWLGTQYGIKVMAKDGRIDYLGPEYGLSNATIQSICEDNNRDVWVSTINAIYKIGVKEENGRVTYRMVCLEQSKSQAWDALYDFSSLKTKSGRILFGKMNGFCAFTPENVVFAPCKNKPLFNSFRLFDTPVTCGDVYKGHILFEETIDRSGKVLLDYDDNFISLGFSSLNFVNPSQTYFRFILEGIDKKWSEMVSENRVGNVTYNHLPSGKFVFRVQAAGNDHRWGPEATFDITIRPPFWNTVWARVFYVLCLAGALYGFVLYQKLKNNRKLLQMKEQEAVRQKEELNQMKFRFFTNVSHELRTPLTLIMTPLEILRKKTTDSQLHHYLDIIYKNAKDLYELVNQLLDFRKIEMQMEKLHLFPGEMNEFVTSVYAQFQTFATEKKIDFQLQTEEENLFMYFDHDKLHKIINNLLSNAFKFTAEGGTIVLRLLKVEEAGRMFVKIVVEDSGIGISEEQLPHIFERFYQVQHWDENKVGSGIGLHLVKEYIQIHEGKITVTSTLGRGTAFSVFLPMDLKPAEKEGGQVDAAQKPEAADKLSEEPKEDRKKILLVEDNEDVRAFLKEQLEEIFVVLDAADGEDGERCAIEHNPDLIVSDIMIPKVDGIELCRRIKTNVQTSHIPVILLTARTADDIKLSSYEVGADSYIAKPFNWDVLLVRIRKLIEQQEKRKREFRRNIRVNPSTITITSLDEQLIQKALEHIERNIDNPEYNVESLSRDMAMSRMNLYRKLQSVTGQTPTEFIRTIRLKRAAQLLQGSQLTMVEVADRVGFSSSSYFTKCFKEQFGVLPTQYAENEELWDGKSEARSR